MRIAFNPTTRGWLVNTLALLGLAGSPLASRSANCPSGEDQCSAGFVWREAFPGDHVCVTGAVRVQAQHDNDLAEGNHLPSSEVCRAGLVWRDAEPDDHVCVNGTIRSQAAADNAAAASRRNPVCKEPTGANTLDTLTLNFAGTGGGMGPDAAGVPFEVRARRLAIWARRNRVVPDVISIQEIYGWLYTPPIRSCGRGFGVSVGDYDEVDAILKSMSDMTGVTYRVAYLTGRVSSFGTTCGLYHAHAMLYNPARLVNLTQAAGNSVAHDAEAGLLGKPHLRRSLPLCSRGTLSMPLASLIDGAPQTDKCNRATPSGPADAVFTEHGHIAGTHIRFAFVGRPGKFIDVFNLHPTSGAEQEDKSAIQQLMSARLPPPYAGSSLLYPPLILGDLNVLQIEQDFPQFQTVMNIAGDVGRVGVAGPDAFPTQLRVRATRKLIVPDLPSSVPADDPCGLGSSRYLVSDHCGLFVRFDADGADAALLRGVFIDGPTAVAAGAHYDLQAVPSGGGSNLKFKWTPGGSTTAAVAATAGPPGSTTNWGVDVTDPTTGTVRTGQLAVRSRPSVQPSPCATACQASQSACLHDRTNPGWPKPTWCNDHYRNCVDQCTP